jgi:hypothetical protein
MKKVLIIVCMGSILGALAWLTFRHHAASRPMRAEQPQLDLPARDFVESPRLALLTREVDALRDRVDGVEANSGRRNQEPDADARDSDLAEEDNIPETPEEIRERKVSAYSGALQAEARDPVAAGEFERALEAGFREIQHSSLGKVDCRSTLCRIEISHLEPDAREKFSDFVLGSGPLKYGGFTYLSEDGETTIAYIRMPNTASSP